jgi:serpin B
MNRNQRTLAFASLLVGLMAGGCDTSHNHNKGNGLTGMGDNPKFDMRTATGQHVATSNASTREIAARVARQNEFAWQLYGKAHEGGFGRNMVMSPFSVESAFLLLAPALDPQSAPYAEYMRALQLTSPLSETHEAMKGYLFHLDQTFKKKIEEKRNEWVLANQVWVDKRFDLNPTYLQTIKSYYNAGVGVLDFRTSDESREEARLTINRFVEDKTKDLIKDLIPRGSFDADTVTVLTNSVYMLADWKYSFNADLTHKAPFDLLSGASVDVDMMERKGTYGYAEGADYTALSIPYANDELEMLVILPREKDGLAALAQNFNGEAFKEILRSLKLRQAKLYLPKFNFSWGSKSLTQPLQELGLKSVFHRSRDNFPNLLYFNGAPWTKETWIQDVVHQAKIIVDEKGTEAAAATGIIVATVTSVAINETIFRVDHPALFVVYDKTYGGVLFLGHLANPAG